MMFRADWRKCGGIFDLASKQQQVEALEKQMESPEFWGDPDAAQRVIAECNGLRAWTIPYGKLKVNFESVQELLPEASELGDEALLEELEAELGSVEVGLEELEVRRMLSGELDSKGCYLSINAGAGGTEACDWAQMLARMYERWATRRGWKWELVDFVPGDVAGYKSVTLRFDAPFAFGYSRAEVGVHRLVRISPYDSGGRRHTSFASVEVTPEVGEDVQVEIRPEDVRIDTFRSSGAGGQHVNVTDSAVRLTHLPTGVVVSCQKERSQLQNKETCFRLLRAKLYELEVRKREEELAGLSGEKKEIAWGSQIRNYVFHPYTMVKDTRTKWESTNVQGVMDGDLDPFVIAFLKEFG